MKPSTGPTDSRFRAALLAVWLASSGLLFLGLTRPVIEIQVNVVGVLEDALDRQPIIGLMLQERGFDLASVADRLPPSTGTRKSVVTSTIRLYEMGAHTAATLILLFSVAVPVLKQAVMLIGCIVPAGRWRRAIAITQGVHKWAMLDVFVLAMVVLGLSSATAWNARLLEGFYWFLGYYFSAAVLGILLARLHRRGVHAGQGEPSVPVPVGITHFAPVGPAESYAR